VRTSGRTRVLSLDDLLDEPEVLDQTGYAGHHLDGDSARAG